VIGSGAGGGACAWALAREGVNVLLLEAGPAYDPARDYRLHLQEWETRGFPHKIRTHDSYSIAPLQPLDGRWEHLRSRNEHGGIMYEVTHRKGWRYHHVKGLGGSTLHFAGEAHRMHPAAMRMRSRFGVAADWPLTYEELEPYYCAAERAVGVAGPGNDPHRPRSEPYPLPPHPLSYASQKLKSGCESLGLTWVPNSLAALSLPYAGRPNCNYCGNCARGCPRLDKGSVDVALIRPAVATGYCRVLTGRRVIRIEPGADDRVSSVLYMEPDGSTETVRARAYVVACGAVHTPRLLLNSRSRRAPDGLANESGQVGKNFQETLAWTSTGLHPERLDSYRGLPSDGVCWDFNAPDAIPGIVGGCRFSAATAEADLLGPIKHAMRIAGGWGSGHMARMRERFGHTLSIGAIGENLPNPGSFIDLDPDLRDDLDMPLARIHSHLDDQEIRRLEFMAQKCRAILAASGVEKTVEEYGNYDAFSSTHVMGTCRMGEDSEDSVLDSYCRSHRWRNLYVVDASVFPSSGGGESPSLTIEALALRAADHIRKRLSERAL
jgi:choline dehydrogenase-like flavoprotein